MRFQFPNLTRPKKSAKILSDLLDRPLSQCQAAVSRACGYQDWHELEQQVRPDLGFVLDQNLTTEDFIARQIETTLSISAALAVTDNDAQFALTLAGIFGNRKPSLSEQLSIRAGCLRKTSLPSTGKRQRGSVGRIKSPGWNGQPAILKQFGRPTYVFMHKAPNNTVADFEFIAPRREVPLFVPSRLYVAYGTWIEPDGSHVLFSRDYKPMWRIRPGEKPVRANPWERIRFVKQSWFWDDTNTPWWNQRRLKEETERLESLGVTGLPKLVEALPDLVLRDDLKTVDDAVGVLKTRHDLSV